MYKYNTRTLYSIVTTIARFILTGVEKKQTHPEKHALSAACQHVQLVSSELSPRP